MSAKHKAMAGLLVIVLIILTAYIIYMNYHPLRQDDIDIDKTQTEYSYILEDSRHPEKFKIMGICINNDKVYAIVHLDNGNIKMIHIEEAYIDPLLSNISEGYLYRENGQIYIKKE